MSDSHAESVAFVRKSFLEPQPAPVSETGMAHWLRARLFPNPVSALLTLVSLWFIWFLLSGFLPWLLGGVWQAGSLAECREILQGATGGCFAVLTERWPQLLFGFAFPPEARIRVAIAFLLLFVSAAPVMFPALPRRLLLGTALYPFLAYWLIWGGALVEPVVVIFGLIAAGLAFQRVQARGLAAGFLAAVAVALVVWTVGLSLPLPDLARLTEVPSRDMGGFMLNLMLGTICVSLSLPIGVALALGRQSSLPIIKGICVVFIEFVRGVPLITLLFVANVVLAYFLPPGSNFDLILRVIIMMTMFASAYIAEVVRGGLAALPRGQYEAADALGLDYAQAMRLVILPQALKISIPGIVNVAVGLFKDTTLVSVISMYDLVGMIRGPVSASTDWNGIYWELWFFAVLLFFPVCYGISQYSQWLERRLATDHR